jgi:hypothetical protein
MITLIDEMLKQLNEQKIELFKKHEEFLKINKKYQKTLEDEIEQLKALAISLSPNANLIYTKQELALQKLSDINQEFESELTNEEIMEVANEVDIAHKNWGYFQIEFARAIIKKATEK